MKYNKEKSEIKTISQGYGHETYNKLMFTV